MIVLLAALGVASLIMILNEVFNGPSETARNVLAMSLIEASATKWIPAKFIGEETVEEIRKKEAAALPVEKSDPTIIKIQDGSIPGGENDRFAGHPDGIVIEKISGDTFNAYVMLIKDPSSIYPRFLQPPLLQKPARYPYKPSDRAGGRDRRDQRRRLLRRRVRKLDRGQCSLRACDLQGQGPLGRRRFL